MAASDSSEQLHQLRSQLDALEQERKARAASAEAALAAAPDPASPDTESALNIPEELTDWLTDDGEIDAEAILERLKDSTSRWLEGLDEDLKDTKPSTILLVFGLGVMVGRLSK